MATTAIDTLRFARKLKQAGLPDDQAEAMAAALGEELTEHLATKADLRLVQWMVGFNLAFSAAILWRILDAACTIARTSSPLPARRDPAPPRRGAARHRDLYPRGRVRRLRLRHQALRHRHGRWLREPGGVPDRGGERRR